MYIRFAGLDHEPSVGVAPGVFWVSADLPRDGDWRLVEIGRVVRWFDAHLETPDRLERRIGRRGRRQGVCWFRDEARQHIAQARYLAWLLNDIGRPVRELRAENPGIRLWHDAHQAVFIPDRDSRVRVL